MAVKTFSVSMDERTWRHAKSQAERAGVSLSAWVTRAAREKLQRDGATAVAAIDERSGNEWAQWTEASERDQDGPEAGKGAA